MKHGFTLIELLLYVSVVGIVILSISAYLSMLQHQGARSMVISETEDQTIAPMLIMTQIIRNAVSVSSPAPGSGAASATVTVPTSSLSPTIFSLNAGTLTIQEGTAAAVPLTSPRVTVSNLTFTNMTTATSPGSLRIQYTVSYINPGNMPEYTYIATSTGSATLR